MTQAQKWTLVVATWAIAAGLVLITIGFDQLPKPGNPYPNTQHVSTIPSPRR
jgi:hypothetical protein